MKKESKKSKRQIMSNWSMKKKKKDWREKKYMPIDNVKINIESQEKKNQKIFFKNWRKKKKMKNDMNAYCFADFLLLDCWMIYSAVFLCALLNCYSCCYCNFIDQVDMRKSVTLRNCYRLQNRKGRKWKKKFKENPFISIR